MPAEENGRERPAGDASPDMPDWVADWNRAVDDWNDACRGRL